MPDRSLYKYISQYWGPRLNRFSELKTSVLLTGYKGIPLGAVARYLVAQQVCEEVKKNPLSQTDLGREEKALPITSQITSQISKEQSQETVACRPCFECRPCESLFNDSGLYIHNLKPEGHFIKVHQVREILNFLSYQREHLTVILIEDIHLMNLQAANALLKTLEEPPLNCWFIMTSHSSQSVLTTIRSRSVVIPVPPMDFSKYLGLLDDPPSLSDLDIKYIQGRWDRYKNRQDYFSKRLEVQNCISSIAERQKCSLLEEKMSKEEWAEVIEILRFLLTQKAEGVNPYDWSKFCDRLNELESALWANVDLKILEEQLVYLLKENHVFH